MRAEFAQELTELAERDPRVVLLTGDLGFTVWESFAERHPDRFFNVGVAEQNMLGLATGLAEAGYVPFVYSIATFASMRPYEFLRNGAVLHRLPVRLVGVGAGFDYGPNGVTHYALEDVGLMRLQPDLAILTPADPAQCATAVRVTGDLDGPLYFRLGRASEPVAGLDGRFSLGRVDLIGEGSDVALIALGTMAAEAVAAAAHLQAEGIHATVGVVSNLAPAPVADLRALVDRVSLAVTVESHYVVGGIGALVAEVMAEMGAPCRLVRAGVREMPRGETGPTAFLNARHGIDAASLTQTVRGALVRAES